jgi:hypothetical protein
MLRGQLHRLAFWRSIGDFRSLAKKSKSEHTTTPPFRGLHRGDLIAMNRKNVSAWRNHIRKPTEARIVNDVLASPSHPGHD